MVRSAPPLSAFLGLHDFDLALQQKFGLSAAEWLLPPLPQSSDSGLGQVGQSLHLTLLPPKPLPRRPPKAWRTSKGILLVKIWRFPASGLGHSKNSCKKSKQNNPCKDPRQKIHTKSAQKICAKNPCKNPRRNPCKTNPCKWLPHSNPAN